MDWRALSVAAMLLYGIGTYFVARATPVHGPNNAAFLQMAVYAVMLLVVRFGRDDLARFTSESFVYGLTAATLFVVGSFLIFAAIGAAPEKAAVTEGLVAAHFIVSGILVHVLIRPMTLSQWVGILIILAGVVVTLLASRP